MAIVKYFVHDLGLDANAIDTEGQTPNYWGTSLCCTAHAAHGDEGKDVVRSLLDRGASPLIKDDFGMGDALIGAECNKNIEISKLLRA